MGDLDKRYWLETYGCQMNVAESHALEAALQEAGLSPADNPQTADYAILNTCSVRQTAENRIWGRIGYYHHLKQSHPLTLVLTGCMAERLGDDFFKKASAVDYVLGTNDKQQIASLLGRHAQTGHADTYSFTESYLQKGEFSSFVPIMNGCDNFCTYCIVPYVRGREISRCAQSIYDEVARLEDAGVREITLLGQNVNSYRCEEHGMVIYFPDLLSTIASRVSSIKWIRFESPHPKDFSPHLIEVLAQEQSIAKHLHIPVQSGSTGILTAMNRRYTRKQYLSLIELIRQKSPHITFTTDAMVGFPGETEEDYQETCSLFDEVQFLEAFLYYFNPREGTKAYDMPNQIPLDVRMQRLKNLIERQRQITRQLKEARCNREAEVLVLGVSKRNSQEYLAKTEHNEMVVFTPPKSVKVGDMVFVRLNGMIGNTYSAIYEEKEDA